MAGRATKAEVAAQCFPVGEADSVALADIFAVATAETMAKLVSVLAAVEAVAPYMFAYQARARSAMETVGTDRMPVAGVEVLGMAALAASVEAGARAASVTAARVDLAAAAARPLVLATVAPSVDMPTLRMVAAAPAWVAPFSATARAPRS